MILLHKTSKNSSLNILDEGFQINNGMVQDRVASFIANHNMYMNNNCESDECYMFFMWNGEVIIDIDSDRNIENMEKNILYISGNWRACIIESAENLIFLGATLSGPNEKADIPFYQRVSVKMNDSIRVNCKSD